MATVRSAKVTDAEPIAGLLGELGYAATADLVAVKLSTLAHDSHDAVFVAELSGILCGVIGLHTSELFHREGRLGRVTALMVSSTRRGQGVGTRLLEAADRFFLEQGCVRAEVTSGHHWHRAHHFYELNGYMPDERRFVKAYEQLKQPEAPE